MGMDLKPMRPHKNAPRREDGKPEWGRYNISGWAAMYHFLAAHGVDTSEMSGYNDGDLIKAATCKNIADTIAKNIKSFARYFGVDATSADDLRWIDHQILRWRTCGGYRQY